MNPKRNRVYLSQTLEEKLRDELIARDLIPISLNTVADFENAAIDGECRTLIFHTSEPLTKSRERRDLLSFIGKVVPDAILRGCHVAVIVDGGAQPALQRAYVAEQVDAAATPLGLVDPKQVRAQVLLINEIGPNFAQDCARHNPGRPWSNIDIREHVDPQRRTKKAPTTSMFKSCPEDKKLLQRAFSDCDGIDIRLVQKRGTGSKVRRVFEVRPYRAEKPELIPFIVKTGYAEKIEEELGATELACGEHTPYSYFPPIADSRRVTGQTRSALVTHFVERALLFEKYIQSHSPAVAVASLFDGPLRCWRSHITEEPVEIGRYALKKGIIRREPKAYNRAYQGALARDASICAPEDLIERLKKLSARTVNYCMSHGDLHMGNIFVRENSVDVVLIDFNRAEPAPASRDPAELDTSLGFAITGDGKPGLSQSELQELYSKPLLGRKSSKRSSHPRMLAIEQVRRQTSGIVTEEEYCEMIAAHCLWYAKRGNIEAYRAATRLI